MWVVRYVLVDFPKCDRVCSWNMKLRFFPFAEVDLDEWKWQQFFFLLPYGSRCLDLHSCFSSPAHSRGFLTTLRLCLFVCFLKKSEQVPGAHLQARVLFRVWDKWARPVWVMGIPESSVGKESGCSAGDPSSIPESGRSAGEGTCYPLLYS